MIIYKAWDFNFENEQDTCMSSENDEENGYFLAW